MKRIVDSSLIKKAFIALVVVLLPVVVAFIYNYQSNKTFLKLSSLNALTAIAEAYEGQVYQFLELSRRRAQDFSSDGFVISSLRRIEGGDAGAAKPLAAHLKKNKLPLDKTIDRIYVVDGKGRVVAATNEVGAGRDVSAEPFFSEGRRSVMLQEIQTPSGRPELAVAAPIKDVDTGKPLGVIVNFIEFIELGNVLAGELSKDLGAVSWQKGRLKTMEIYLVNKEMLMVSESLLTDGRMMFQKVDTDAVKACIDRKEEISGFYTGYRGTSVAGASMCLPLMRWTLIVEVDEQEVYAPLSSMMWSAVVVGVIVLGIVGALFLAFYKVVVARLLVLGQAAGRVAGGEYDEVVPIVSADEIGALAGSFNRMAVEVKRREIRISRSEERLRAVIDNSIAVISLKGLDGAYKLVNKQYEKLFGLTNEKIIGMTDYEIFPPEQASSMRANDMLVVQTRQPREFEETITQGDGLHYYISVKVPVFDASGEPFGVCGISTDITERKRLESEHRLVQIISEALNESRDFADALVLTVRKICEMTGWDFGEVWIPNSDGSGLSLKCCSLCGGGRMDECRLHESNKNDTLLQQGAGLPGRVLALKKVEWVRDVSVDGDVFLRAHTAIEAGLRSCVGMPVISDGRVLAVIVFFMRSAGALEESYVNVLTDVSDQIGGMLGRRLAEVARREVMRRYEDLVNNLSVGVYRSLPGPDNRLVEANRALIEILEAGSRDELLTHGLMDFCKDTARCMELEAELMRQGHVNGAELDLVTLKGKALRVSVTAVKKEDSDGKVYFDGIMEDVSEKRLLEEQFLHSQKLEAVGRLAGGMAHDFNNILTAVIGYANLVKIKCVGNEAVSSFAEHILTLSESASMLTQGLLAFSRKRPLSLQPVDMNDLVRRAATMLTRLIGEDIEVRINPAAGELVVMADNAQMEQVLMNLATNARDAMPDGGRLMITTAAVEIDQEFVSSHGYGAAGSFAQVIFEDTGIGMDRETAEHIFEPFYTTKEVGKGTGLGLAMVYGTIKQHDGFINVYSEPGSGTVFRIYLPLIKASMVSIPAMDESTESYRGTETILLAEDQSDVREVTRRLFEEFGYRVIEAANGEEALERFREEGGAIDLVMLDMKMPKKGGAETYEYIKKIKYDIKVIFMSGYSEEILHLRETDGKAVDFISKPASPAGMLRKVREVLDR